MPSSKRDAATQYNRIIKEAGAVCPKGQWSRFEPFLRHYYAYIAPDVLLEIPPREAAAIAYRHWTLAARRARGKPLVHVYNTDDGESALWGSRTILEVVTDDMPFLVDSVRMEVNRQGYTVNLAVHPIYAVERQTDGRLKVVEAPGAGSKQRESFIHLEVERLFDPGRLDELQQGIESVLGDVRRAVNDWRKIRNRLHGDIEALDEGVTGVGAGTAREVRRFLQWLDEKNFTFLGYERMQLTGGKQQRRFTPVPRTALGILRGKGHELGTEAVDNGGRRRGEQSLLLVTKSGQRSTVHRPGYMDYIAVRHFDKRGRITGESRYLGLYTSVAYRRHPREVPLIRAKINTAIERAGYDPGSHTGKTFLHILETYPRDELFQISVDKLYKTAKAILHLADRQRVKLFVREDRLRRFVVCMVYVPRDRYDTNLRLQMSDILREGFQACDLDFNVRLTDESFARVEYFIQTDPQHFPSYDADAIEQQLARAARTWADELRRAVLSAYREHDCVTLLARYGHAFSVAYQEDFDVHTAVDDIRILEQLGDRHTLHVKLYSTGKGDERELRLKLYNLEAPIAPSDSLPILENMGVKVVQEKPYKVRAGDGTPVWIHDHRLVCHVCDRDVMQFKDDFEEIFAAVWFDEVESDGFNALGLLAGLSAREISLVRGYCKYLLQGGLTYSQAYIEQCLQQHAGIVGDLLRLFTACFDPAQQTKSSRSKISNLKRRIRRALEAVTSRDHDRILRNFFGVIRATLRTNYYRGDPPEKYIALKFDSARVPELPQPRPMYEIFVYSPRTEAIHLRAGKVARGGLRWSDRREDFRTEVLKLVKAQKVKNAVIVPTGAKGGFVVKRPPAEGGREALTDEAIACYRQFISGMLDLTDNLVDDRMVPPADVVRYDGDDNYLVVAADKGTASFSDIANDVALSRDFWLGDAFASGGSKGYDHKAMGITARGAWEAVRLHFRDLGTDIQEQAFTVAGIGDMSGDVFGNGMLLSKKIKLVAAFNHLHIFLDPDPDPDASYKERRRLFRLSRSTWEDYNSDVISKGGGVYSRDAKSIKLTEPVRALLGTDAGELPPNELIQLILQAEVDLLWNGGIGTYVKAAHERHGDVGDRANDSLRIDAGQLRCKVIGEGGNLGLTQQSRIEFALNGGRVDTDFIHNAGGVDCSDHEVNIKILLNKAKTSASLTENQRVKLLEQMTEEVARLVLEGTYWQTQAITLVESEAPQLLDEHARYVGELESQGHLNRKLENLPDEEQLVERKAAGMGLTRPEIAVLLSYSKSVAQDELAESDLWDDAHFSAELQRYFPEPLRRRYGELIDAHPLRREILAMFIVNRMLNRMGGTYLFRMQEETGAGFADITRAYTIAWEVFNLRQVWSTIAALDNRVPAGAQIQMMLEVSRLNYRASKWLIQNHKRTLSVEQVVGEYRQGAEVLMKHVPRMIEASDDANVRSVIQRYTDQGVEQGLAVQIAGMDALYCTFDVVDIGARMNMSVHKVMDTYFAVSAYLDIYWLRVQLRAYEAQTHWQDLARRSHLDDLYRVLALLTTEVLRVGRKNDSPRQVLARWHKRNPTAVDRCLRVPQELKAAERVDLAMFAVALRELKNLYQACSVN